jgi:hypothetical protein
VVVAVGLTVTATPLVAARLPGVMTPVPFAKTPVSAALDPAAMEVGLAVKLVIEGCVVWLPDDPPPQAVNPASPRARIMASGARTKRRFMSSPCPPQVEANARPSGTRHGVARNDGGKSQTLLHTFQTSRPGSFRRGSFQLSGIFSVRPGWLSEASWPPCSPIDAGGRRAGIRLRRPPALSRVEARRSAPTTRPPHEKRIRSRVS